MRDVLVNTELEQARMAREEEMGMWKRRAEEAEQQIWNWTDELVALREENKQIKEELDVRKAEVCIYGISTCVIPIVSISNITSQFGIRLKAPSFDEDCLQLHRVLAPAYPMMMKYMWQSRVEIEDYSIAYFDRLIAFMHPRSTYEVRP